MSPSDPTPGAPRAPGEPSAGATRHDASLDPANQSLADALRITLRLVQGGMVVLAVLFALSGFQSIRENERAVRLVFGAVDSLNVEPGFQFSYPYPVGELVRVDIGQAELKLEDEFWPRSNDPKNKGKGIDSLERTATLIPGQGGSLITADENIAHSQWKVLYTREKPDLYARNVLPENERVLVRAAVRRGVVHSCAKIDIDALLKQSGGDTSPVASLAKRIAQEQLDHLQSGIRIQQLLMEQVMPPVNLRERFNNVLSANAEAGSTIEKAQSEASRILTEKAGEAAGQLRTLIEAYDVSLRDPAQAAEAAKLLADIQGVISGGSVAVDGRQVLVSGEVAKTINEATQYRSEIVSRRRAEYNEWEKKFEQFKNDPRLMVASEIQRAVEGFMGRSDVQIIAMPPGTSVFRIHLSPDPEVQKEIDEKARVKRSDEIKRQREDMLEKEKYKPKEGGGQVAG